MGIYERPRRSPGKRLFTLLALLALVMSVGLFAGGAGAVHNEGLFELDGNAIDEGTAGQDWDTTSDPPAIDTSFITDPFNDDDDIFTGGASKDDLPIEGWEWTTGTAPDKDDFEHVFASAYIKDGGTPENVEDDELFLYFGADRYAVNGSTNVGFWFFQNDVAPNPDGGFDGTHEIGDILVVSEFTNGGSIPTIIVYEWNGTGLTFVGANAAVGDAFCNELPLDKADSICAVVNDEDIESPWPYTPKAGDEDVIPPGGFFEGGINLTTLFGDDLPCLSSYLANTRTSFETNSVLKDFAGGPLNVCGKIIVEKQTNPPGSTEEFGFSGEITANLSDNETAEKEVDPGVYTVTEATKQFWTLTSIQCDDGNSTGDTGTRAATFRVSPGETVKCTFNNSFEKQPSTTATDSNPKEQTVLPGTSVSDTATVTGIQGGPVPTGTVQFYLCQPAAVTASGCEAGDAIGAPVALVNGSATSQSTSNTLAEGKYCWRAVYSGDSFYLGDPHTNTTTECFTVDKLPSQTGTTSTPTGGNIIPGTPATDTATVTGTGPAPTGTVTFYICKPGETNGSGCPAGTQVGSPVALVAGSATSAAFTDTTAVGLYCWRAVYSGDTVYEGSAHTNLTSECFTVAKRPSTTVTTSSPDSDTVVPGTSVSDTATVSGNAGTPTGTVSFFLCQPDEVTAAGCPQGEGTQVGGAVALTGGQATSASTDNTTAIGMYCWRAEYSGSTVYESSWHTNATTECFTTVKQPSEVETTSDPTDGGVLPGTPVTDHAVVSGNGPTPTGSVEFFLCQPDELTAGECPTGGTSIGTVALVNGEATSASTDNTTAIGTYCWRAEYSGDGFYNESSHTNDDSECFTTLKQPSNTVTTSNPTGGNVVPGTEVTDTATVSGGEGQPTPTGSVEFFLCQPDELTAGECPTGGTSIGEVDLVDGSATSAGTDDTTAIGTYCWRAEYSGDDFYDDSSHTNSTTECFTTVKQPSETQTTSSPTGGDVVPGTSVKDLATVSGGPGQQIPTGDVTFFLCQPDELDGEGECSTGGTQIGEPVALDDEGDAESASTDDTTAIGTYCWRAEYEGDDFYNASSHTNADSECFTTVKQPSEVLTTSSPNGGNVARGTTVSDTATVGGDGPVPTGTVTFYLCQPNQVGATGCTAGTQIGGAVALQNGVAQSATTNNTNADGKYCWRAVYSGDDFYLGDEHTNTTTECFTVVPPPPPPPNPLSDIRVTKAATPQVTLQQGQTSAPITYNIVVINNGPDPATNAVLMDPNPTGVQFTGVTSSKGTCTFTPSLVDCKFGTMAVGEQITVTIQATVSVTGTVVNVVTVNASNDSVPSNNTAQAPTLVVAPVTPPPTPKPKPKPEICDTLTVTQKALKANGKKQKVTAKVTEGGKPVKGAKVVLTGPGVKKTGKTNSKGVVTFTISPKRSGIIRVEIRGSKACNTQRIGVVGVFEPPVTG